MLIKEKPSARGKTHARTTRNDFPVRGGLPKGELTPPNLRSFILDLQENIYKKVKKAYYMPAGFAGRHVVGLGDLSIDVFLEVQNKRYS